MKACIYAILAVLAASGGSPTLDAWSYFSSMVGRKIDAKRLSPLFEKYGSPAIVNVSGSAFTWDLERGGISIKCADQHVIEIILQIAPGKRISDVTYSGSLPDKVIECRVSPEKAIEILGKPQKDITHGYRQLTYSLEGVLMTLYYGPSLDFVSFSPIKAEQDAAANP